MADNIALKKGDIVRVVTAGGGGWGDPLDRDAELVAWDVCKGYVSSDAARDDYGVIVDADGRTADNTASTNLRSKTLAAKCK
jgi:N-methylhydantoinase B